MLIIIIILIFSILRLCGFPFLVVGYYFKDLIIEYFFFRKIVYFSIINLIVGTIFTVSYSFRIILVITRKYLILNVIYRKEDKIICISILLMIIFRLIYRKLIFNLIRINLLLIYKLIVFKIITVGIIMGYKIGYLKMRFLFINLIYKVIYKKIIIIIFTYEVYVEKSIIEILSRKFMSVTLNIYELKISNLKINIYLTILIYVIYLLIYIINF